jgi:hypothetical protein
MASGDYALIMGYGAMDSDDWMFALFMANEERRRAQRDAQEEKEELKEEYDQWCLDHGIPPPPDRVPEIDKGAGCLCMPVVILCIALVVFFVFLLGRL